MKQDYFEIERVIEELAKNYAAPCTTTWFKVTSNRRPSADEYREKVVDFMKQFEADFVRAATTKSTNTNMFRVY